MKKGQTSSATDDRIALVTWRTLTRDLVVDDLALRVGGARVPEVARIHAPPVHTRLVGRAAVIRLAADRGAAESRVPCNRRHRSEESRKNDRRGKRSPRTLTGCPRRTDADGLVPFDLAVHAVQTGIRDGTHIRAQIVSTCQVFGTVRVTPTADCIHQSIN